MRERIEEYFNSLSTNIRYHFQKISYRFTRKCEHLKYKLYVKLRL